ncbi:MAG: S8 family serine peptidase [Cyanobacteria bacterium SBC]|nr:S8 family serine peptidase [Cyanobacteria bacterium SBC]
MVGRYRLSPATQCNPNHPDDDLAGDTIDTALNLGKLDGTRAVRDFVGTVDTEDYYRVCLDSDGSIGVMVRNSTADVDLELLRENGDVLAGSYNWGDRSEQFDRYLEAGTYIVRVVQYEGSTDYELVLSDTPLDPAGNSFDEAFNLGTLSTPQNLTGFLNESDRDDYYRFDLTQETDVSLSLKTFHGNANLELIRDENGNGTLDNGESLSASENRGNYDDAIEMTLTAGTYFVRVKEGNFFSENNVSDYHLALNSIEIDGAGDSCDTALDLGNTPDGAIRDGFIGRNNPVDYYRFNLDRATDTNLVVHGLSTRTDLELTWDSNEDGTIDDLDECVYSHEASSSGNFSVEIDRTLNAGTYYLSVNSEGGNSRYTLATAMTAEFESDTVGNTLASAADWGTLETPIWGSEAVGFVDNTDFYRFTLDERDEIEVLLYGLSEDVDLELIRDGNGNGEIETEDILAGSYRGYGAESIRQSIDAGTYFVRVFSYDNEDSNYELFLNRSDAFSEIEAGGEFETAAELGIVEESISVRGSSQIDGDEDYYRFELDTDSAVSFLARDLSDYTTVTLIRDAEEPEVLTTRFSFRDASRTSSDIVQFDRYLEAGSYFVRLGSSKPGSEYALTLAAEPMGLEDGVGDSIVAALNLGNLGESWQTVGEGVGGFDRADYYRFTLTEEREVSLLLYGENESANLELVRDDNNNGAIDDGETLANPMQWGSQAIECMLSAGTYFACVTGSTWNESNYRLNLRSLPVTMPETIDSIDYEIEIPDDRAGNSFETARDLGSIDEFQSFVDGVNGEDPNDTYCFNVTQNSEFSVLFCELRDNLNVTLFQAETGEEIDSFYTWGNMEEFSTFLSTGSYYLQVTPDSDNAPTAYRLSVLSDAIADTAGNALVAARDLGNLEGQIRFDEFVGAFDSEDVYRFNVAGNHAVSLAVQGLSSNADVQLGRDDNGNGSIDPEEVLDLVDSSDSLAEWQFDSLEAGTYYLRVVNPEDGERYSVSLQPTLYSLKSGYGLASAATALGLGDIGTASGKMPWGVDRVDASAAWAQGYTGEGVVVAVIDTGVDTYHEDLAENIWTNAGEIADNGIDDDGNGFIDDVRGWDFAEGNNDPADLHGHGTHVSGTIAAVNNGIGVTGVAPSAIVMPVRVLGASGSGTSSDVADGIRYAADNSADVINLSLGGGYSSEIEAAIQSAVAEGVVVVMAAGNSYGSSPGYPARGAFDRGIAVGAIDVDNAMADFSNRAGVNSDYVVAPGVDVYSTLPNNRYAAYSGTSMATPHVAGIAALLRQANPNATVEEIENSIVRSANPQGVVA